MNDDLKKFIARYSTLTESELDEVAKRFKKKSIRKTDYLFKHGETCKDLIYVSRGCLRLFYLQDDVEVSVWFAFENSSAIDIHSFISGSPSTYFLQAIEDSEVLCLPKPELTKLYRTHPKMQEMMRHFWEDVILHLLERFNALQHDSAETRYLNLLKKPDYLKTIPQKYLASFIGVTPTSLSRIRKKIAR